MLRSNTPGRRAATQGATLTENELTVNARQAEDGIIVDIGGRLTVDSSFRLRPVLHGAVGAAPGAGVVVDFAETTYIDTSAAATLIEAAMLARERSVHLRIVGLRGQPRLLTEIIELDRIFRALGSGYEVVFA
jgi:anti-anti-sigma factor